MPTARNARGIDVVAYSRDGNRYLGLQVKSLSKRAPVPLGTYLLRGPGWRDSRPPLYTPLSVSRSFSKSYPLLCRFERSFVESA